MSVQSVRWIVTIYIMFFFIMTTWPGALFVNRVEPLILGLPFNLFFIAALLIGALIVLSILYISEQRSKTK